MAFAPPPDFFAADFFEAALEVDERPFELDRDVDEAEERVSWDLLEDVLGLPVGGFFGAGGFTGVPVSSRTSPGRR